MLILLLLLIPLLAGCDKVGMEKDAVKDGEQLAADVINDALKEPAPK